MLGGLQGMATAMPHLASAPAAPPSPTAPAMRRSAQVTALR
jgi:hypothetical protein